MLYVEKTMKSLIVDLTGRHLVLKFLTDHFNDDVYKK